MSVYLQSQCETKVEVKNDETGETFFIPMNMGFSHLEWRKLLLLAISYGWEPVGTLKNQSLEEIQPWGAVINDPWDEDYMANAGQIVTAEDAKALAYALESCLDDIPDCKMPEILIGHPIQIGNRMVTFTEANPELHPFEFFGGQNKYKLIEMIAFCRKGPFEIW